MPYNYRYWINIMAGGMANVNLKIVKFKRQHKMPPFKPTIINPYFISQYHQSLNRRNQKPVL